MGCQVGNMTEGKNPSLSLFPPSVALHVSPTSLSLVHSEAEVFEEAWSHSPDSATELMTASWCQLWYWSKMNGFECLYWPQLSAGSHDRIDLSSHYVIIAVQAFLCHLVILLDLNLNGYDYTGYLVTNVIL